MRACVSHPWLVVLSGPLAEGAVEEGQILGPAAETQGEVRLDHPTGEEALLKLAKREAVLPEKKAAARLPVEPVGGRDERGFGTEGVDEVDDAEADPASAMDGKTCGLVEDEAVLILAKDALLEPARIEPGWRTRGVSEEGGKPDPVARVDALRGRDPPSVQADLTGAEEAVDFAPGPSPVEFHEEIVDPLAVLVRRDGVFRALRAPGGIVHRRSSTYPRGRTPLTSKTT